MGVPSLHWSLQNLKQLGFIPSVIIDIGAYEGNWTQDVLEVFPNARVLMVEAQRQKEAILRQILKKYSNTDCSIALLSSERGLEKFFYECETASHVVQNTSNNDKTCKIVSETLDDLLALKEFPFPDLLKLDAQGHEMEILKGADKSLRHAEICLLEITLIDIGDQIPLLAEMISFMDKRNFQAYDISQFMRRPFDKALYQVDMFFIKKDSSLIADKRWA